MALSRGNRLLVVGGLTLAVAGGGVGTAVAVSQRPHDGPNITYSNARTMADKAECAATFKRSTNYAGILSAGTCRVAGAEVEFRVFPSMDAAYAWVDGTHGKSGGPAGFNVVGDGWVAHSLDQSAMNQVSRALTTP
jgi:hypothetical protein